MARYKSVDMHLSKLLKELFAVDGCKLPSNASRTWSGTRADLAKSAGDVLRRQQGQRQLLTNRGHESPDR